MTNEEKLVEIAIAEKDDKDDFEFKENLAAFCHKQWIHWMEYLFEESKIIEGGLFIPHKFYVRWVRQMNTEYRNLSEKEKESDRKQADKFIKLINHYQ